MADGASFLNENFQSEPYLTSINLRDNAISTASIVTQDKPNEPFDDGSYVIRECPPENMFVSTEEKKITLEGAKTSIPKRKLIVEKLPQIPEKPASVTVERWLSHSKIRQKVIFNKSPQPIQKETKNLIIEWENPEVKIKNELKYLGIVEADPIEYAKTYGSTLNYCNNLPPFASEIKAPDGFKLASECDKEDLIELYGDVEALRLIDLEKEGLGEYKKILEKYDSSFESTDLTNVSSLEST